VTCKKVSKLRYEIGAGDMRKEGEWIKTIPGNNWDRGKTWVTELLLRNRASVNWAKFFRAPCRKNCVGSKNDWHLFNGLDELYHQAKFGEDRTSRTGL